MINTRSCIFIIGHDGVYTGDYQVGLIQVVMILCFSEGNNPMMKTPFLNRKDGIHNVSCELVQC
jgi:hypothetical protein